MDETNGFNFVYFWINKIWYVRIDTGSLLPPDKGQEVGGYKFLGGWYVCLQHSGVMWVGKL